ncbi:hypothetical protein NDU88_000666 [Pleurodeles waltl]|uniref:Uncharacterized protein n=1 Tax=Pleurodeles waltl TaxID=8319 RepID=A0AAV7S6R9_PLEWA|nr:hypothetical protein NDU88_000666 [Pleurodeles waltl]
MGQLGRGTASLRSSVEAWAPRSQAGAQDKVPASGHVHFTRECAPLRPARVPAAILAAASVQFLGAARAPQHQGSQLLSPHLSKRPQGRSEVQNNARNGDCFGRMTEGSRLLS